MKKTIMLLLFAIMSVLALAGCGDDSKTSSNASSASSVDGETYNFKMSYVTQTGHNWHQFGEKLKEELDTLSDGRMKLELYPAAQLGPEADMVQQLANGSLDFALLTVPYLSTRVPELDAWNLPFLFEDLEAGIEATKTEPAQEMLKLLEPQGLKGIGYLHTGTHSLLLKGDAIGEIADVKGLKLRFAGGASALDYWKEIGASPIAMGLPEVYNALQTGVIDGVSIDTNALLSEKYYEISNNYVLSKHMVFGGIFTGSKENYDKMPEADRKILDEAIEVSLKWGNEQLLINDKEDVEELKSMINIVELSNRDQFVEAAKDTHTEYANKYDLIKQFIELVQSQ